jgi:uncharacterized protein
VIELAKLSAEGCRLEGEAKALSLEGEDSIRDLRWSLRVLPSGQDFFLDIQGEGIWEGSCNRCMELFERPIKVDTQFLGSKDPELVAGGSRTLGSQDLDVIFLPEPLLDEEAMVREQFLLQIPMAHLCKETCEGLCPICGKNWNKGHCQCHPEYQKEAGPLAKALSKLNLHLES